MAAERDPWGERPASDEDDEAEESDAAPGGRLWFLRDPGAMARRLVLAEILAEPRSHGGARRDPRRRG